MAEYTAGSASVPVTPDMSSFQQDVRAELEAQSAELGSTSGKAFGDAFQDQVRAALAELPDATVTVDGDTAPLTAEVDEATKGKSATVGVDADTAPAEAQLAALTKKSWTVKVKAVADKVSDKTGTLGLTELAGAGAVALGPDVAGLAAGLAGIGVDFAAAGADAGAFGVIAKGMFTDVAAAQKSLTTAQQQYAKATDPAQRTAALAAEQAALAKLTPSEKDLLTQLTALENEWKKLSQAEQPVVEGALAPWLQTASAGMRLLSPLIEDGATAVKALGTEADKAVQSPFWTEFSKDLGQTGQVALTDFGEAAGKVGDGLAHLFVAFAPDLDKLPPIISSLAGDFDKWASSVTSGGLDSFLEKTFTPANLKALAADGKDVGTLVENIAKASGDMSPLAFDGVSNLLDILGQLTPTEIEALTGLFLAIKTIGTISKGVSAVAGVVSGVKGLLGLGAQDAETTADGTAAGTAAGESAATAFTAAFQAGVTAGLAEAFAAISAEGTTEAEAFGTGMGTAAATAFSAAFAGEDAAGVEGGLAAAGAAGEAEAAEIGTAAGEAAGTAFDAAFDLDSDEAWGILGAEGETAAAAAGTTWGGSAAGGFTGALTGGDALGLAGAFTTIGAEGTADAAAAGAAWGGAAAGDFAGGLTGTDALGLAGAFVTITAEGTALANGAGAAWGASAAAGFGEGIAGVGSAISGVVGGAGLLAVAGAFATGFALGGAVGGGFVAGFALTGAAGKVGDLENSVKSAASTADTWLQPAGAAAADGFGTGFLSQAAKVEADAAQVKAWTTAGASGSSGWLTPGGQQAATGFGSGFAGEHAFIDSTAASLKSWVTGALPSPLSWLANVGISVVQGFANGIIDSGSLVTSAVSSLANLVPSTIKSLLGINSPAKVVIPLGSAVPEAFGLGVDQGAPFVAASLGRLADTTVGSLSDLANAQSLAALGSLNVPSPGVAAGLPGVGSPLGAGPLQLTVSSVATGDQLTDAIVQSLRFDIQGATGGDVQAHLGQGQVRT